MASCKFDPKLYAERLGALADAWKVRPSFAAVGFS
jgi:hypothetical protein